MKYTKKQQETVASDLGVQMFEFIYDHLHEAWCAETCENEHCPVDGDMFHPHCKRWGFVDGLASSCDKIALALLQEADR